MSEKVRYSRLIWRDFSLRPLAVIAFIFILFLFSMALFAPLLANERPLAARVNGSWSLPFMQRLYSDSGGRNWREWKDFHPDDVIFMAPIPYGPNQYDLDAILEAPSAAHWLGSDEQGRDVLSRLIYGSRISLSIGFVAVSIYVIIGILMGALAGYYGGWIDIIISRLIEVMYCFPTFFLILALLAFIGPNIYNIMIIIGLTSWPGIARLVRGEFLKLRGREFVLASMALGASDMRIIFRHLIPNSLAPVLVSATFGVASAILVESSLSFLGFGVPPHVPSWGDILSQSREFMDIAWWLAVAPGAAIFLTITAYNVVGEGFQEAINPKMGRK